MRARERSPVDVRLTLAPVILPDTSGLSERLVRKMAFRGDDFRLLSEIRDVAFAFDDPKRAPDTPFMQHAGSGNKLMAELKDAAARLRPPDTAPSST